MAEEGENKGSEMRIIKINIGKNRRNSIFILLWEFCSYYGKDGNFYGDFSFFFWEKFISL